jgi:hypothetical protein
MKYDWFFGYLMTLSQLFKLRSIEWYDDRNL